MVYFNPYLLSLLILITIILSPIIYKQFLNNQIYTLKDNTEGLLTSLRGVICTKQARIYKRNIFRGEQYIIKIHTTHSNEHCFVLSIYKNYIHLEIPYSNLNKKISIISTNIYIRALIDEIRNEYVRQQTQESYNTNNQSAIDIT